MLRTTTLAIATAVAGAIAAGTAAAQSGPAPKPDFKFEKCYGVAKAGKNDCQTASNSCAGTSEKDRQADAFVSLPKGLCSKIAGGSLTAMAPAAKKKG